MPEQAELNTRVDGLEAQLATLRQDLLMLTSEVSRNHGLLVQVEGSVRRSAETHLSFTEHQRARVLSELLRPCSITGHSLVRIGSANDGGYVALDDLENVQGVLSGGAGDNVDFEVEMADRGLPVHVYDHTVDGLPGPAREDLQHFREPMGPAGTGLAAALERLGEGDLLLKVDIDGGEWELFAPGTDLRRFRQIVLELHGLTQVGDSLWFERAEQVLRHLLRTHAPYHLHANNFGAMTVVGGVPVPDILEVSWARRGTYACTYTAPTVDPGLDAPNDPTRPEYVLAFAR